MLAPKPTKLNVLQRFVLNGLPISDIIDVGVRDGTDELKRVFPDKVHHLFEPASTFFSVIKRNYAEIENVLYPMALANENVDAFLTVSALEKDGVITHSHISDTPSVVDGLEVIECNAVKIRRFSDLQLKIPENFLLKVDVDGEDLNVVRGFGEKIRSASAIIIEVTYHTAAERLMYIVGSGFQLYDLVDLVYYGPGIYQFDAVFIRDDLLNDKFRPPISDFKEHFWKQLLI